jgi:hypothetical protein
VQEFLNWCGKRTGLKRRLFTHNAPVSASPSLADVLAAESVQLRRLFPCNVTCAQDSEGWTPLIAAASYDHEDIVQV